MRLKTFPYLQLLMALCFLFGACAKETPLPDNTDFPYCAKLSPSYEGNEGGFQILSAYFEDDCMVFNLAYSGGCNQHYFHLVKTDEQAASWINPETRTISTYTLYHDDAGDACQAYFEADVSFDLTTLRVEGAEKVAFYVDGLNDNLFIYRY